MRLYRAASAAPAMLGAACATAPQMHVSNGLAGCPATQQTAAIGVRWVVPTPAAMNEKLAEWCRGAGPVVIEATPTPVEARDSLMVITWNVNAGGGDLLRFLQTEPRLPCQGAAPTFPMVILLQEPYRAGNVPPLEKGTRIPRAAPEGAPRPGPRIDVPAVARRCGLGLYYAPYGRNGKNDGPDGPEDRGVAILASAPLSDPVVIDLPPEAPRRVALAATVNLGSIRIRVVSAHLTTMPLPFRLLTTGNGSRLFQAQALVRGLTLLPPVDATMLAGDLNAWSSRESAIRFLYDTFPDSPRALGLGTRGTFETDYVLFRRETAAGTAVTVDSYRRIDDRYSSDHHPLVLRVRTRGPQFLLNRG